MASAIVGALKVILSADTAEYKTAMQQAGKEAATLSRDFGSIGRQMTAVGSALTKTITLPILGLGVASVKAAADFESSFANVAKTVDGVADSSGTLTAEGQQLAKTFRDMAKEIPATTAELTAIAALGGQMGVPIGQLEHFTRNVAALSVAVDGISAEQAAAGLAQIGNIFGKGTTEIAHMSSALVHLGNSSNATEADILEFSKRLAGAGNAVNMTEAEVMALGTAMANVGINAEAGGTAMSMMITKMSMAVSKGGDALAAFGRVSGLGAQGFAEAWRTSPIEAIDAVVKGLARTKAEGGDLNLVVREIGATNIRTADTMKRLAGAGDGVSQSLRIANEGYAAGNKHLEEAEKKYATFHNQLKLLWNQIKDVGIELGNALLPALKSLVQVAQQLTPVVQALVVAFTSLPTWVQATVFGALALAAAIGPVIWAFGTLFTAAGTVIGAFKAKGVAMRAITAVMGSTSVAAGVLRTALAFLGPAAAVVATAFASWTFGKWIDEWTGLSDAVGKTVTWINELAGVLPKGSTAQYDHMRAAQKAAAAAQAQARALDQAATSTNDLAAAHEFVGPILDRNTNGMDDFVEATDEAKKQAEEFAKSLRELGGRDALGGAQEVVKQLHALDGPLNVLPSKLEDMAARLREGAQAALLLGQSGLANQYDKLADTLDPVIMFQQRYNVTIGDYVTLAPEAVGWTEDLNDQLHRLGGTVQRILPALTSTLDLRKLFAPLKEGVKSHMPDVSAWTDAWSSMKTGLSKTLGDIPQTLANAFTGGGDIMGALKAIVSQIGSTIGAGIGAAFGPLGERIGGAIGSMAGMLVPAFKNIFGIGINDEVKRANGEIEKLRQQLLQTHGPLDVLEQKANAVGLSFRENWGHQGQAGLQAMNDLIAEFNRRWEESEQTLADLNAELKTTQGDLDGVIDRARQMGYEFNAQGEFIGVNFDTMRAKAEEFGVDINSLGPAMRQQALDAEAKKIIDGFTLMSKAAGPEGTGGILTGMKDEIGAIVGRSIEFGTTIPENMRPWVEELIRTGQLVDENGVAITDLSAIKFGEPVATEFEKISSALLEVVNKLNDILSQIAAIPTNRTFTVRAAYEDPGPPQGFGDPHRSHAGGEPGFATGTLGRLGQWFGNFGSGMSTALHGVEAVITPQQAMPFAMDVLAGGGAAGGSPPASMDISQLRTTIAGAMSRAVDRQTETLEASLRSAILQLAGR